MPSVSLSPSPATGSSGEAVSRRSPPLPGPVEESSRRSPLSSSDWRSSRSSGRDGRGLPGAATPGSPGGQPDPARTVVEVAGARCRWRLPHEVGEADAPPVPSRGSAHSSRSRAPSSNASVAGCRQRPCLPQPHRRDPRTRGPGSRHPPPPSRSRKEGVTRSRNRRGPWCESDSTAFRTRSRGTNVFHSVLTTRKFDPPGALVPNSPRCRDTPAVVTRPGWFAPSVGLAIQGPPQPRNRGHTRHSGHRDGAGYASRSAGEPPPQHPRRPGKSYAIPGNARRSQERSSAVDVATDAPSPVTTSSAVAEPSTPAPHRPIPPPGRTRRAR